MMSRCLTDWLADRLSDWPPDWLTARLTNWPLDWLTVQLIDHLTAFPEWMIDLHVDKIDYDWLWLTVAAYNWLWFMMTNYGGLWLCPFAHIIIYVSLLALAFDVPTWPEQWWTTCRISSWSWYYQWTQWTKGGHRTLLFLSVIRDTMSDLSMWHDARDIEPRSQCIVSYSSCICPKYIHIPDRTVLQYSYFTSKATDLSNVEYLNIRYQDNEIFKHCQLQLINSRYNIRL